jgi:hypothetical protein
MRRRRANQGRIAGSPVADCHPYGDAVRFGGSVMKWFLNVSAGLLELNLVFQDVRRTCAVQRSCGWRVA